MIGERRWRRFVSPSIWLMAAAVISVAIGFQQPAAAQLVVFDGFGDADRNNDGTSDNGSVTDAGDVGIPWYGIVGKTSGVSPRQKPALTVLDDSAGLATGNALFVESVGVNSKFVGVFPSTLSLGTNVGDKLVLSFDVRMQDFLFPSAATLRFGLFEDSDNQFGTESTNTDGSQTVWGQTDGNFDACNDPGGIGACNDLGYQARLPYGSSAGIGDNARIYDELNVNDILGGSGDADQIAQPDTETFSAIADNDLHHVIFSLERVMPSPTGTDIFASLQLDDISFGNQDGLGATPNDFTPSGDSFDYVVFRNSDSDFDYVIDNFQIELLAAPSGPNGDFNGDGFVDAADYVVWRKTDQTTPGYEAWQANFGMAVPGGGSGAVIGVPEPASSLIVLVLGCCFVCRRHR
jgi:hypothetical protein